MAGSSNGRAPILPEKDAESRVIAEIEKTLIRRRCGFNSRSATPKIKLVSNQKLVAGSSVDRAPE